MKVTIRVLAEIMDYYITKSTIIKYTDDGYNVNLENILGIANATPLKMGLRL